MQGTHPLLLQEAWSCASLQNYLAIASLIALLSLKLGPQRPLLIDICLISVPAIPVRNPSQTMYAGTMPKARLPALWSHSPEFSRKPVGNSAVRRTASPRASHTLTQRYSSYWAGGTQVPNAVSLFTVKKVKSRGIAEGQGEGNLSCCFLHTSEV